MGWVRTAILWSPGVVARGGEALPVLGTQGRRQPKACREPLRAIPVEHLLVHEGEEVSRGAPGHRVPVRVVRVHPGVFPEVGPVQCPLTAVSAGRGL